MMINPGVESENFRRDLRQSTTNSDQSITKKVESRAASAVLAAGTVAMNRCLKFRRESTIAHHPQPHAHSQCIETYDSTIGAQLILVPSMNSAGKRTPRVITNVYEIAVAIFAQTSAFHQTALNEYGIMDTCK